MMSSKRLFPTIFVFILLIIASAISASALQEDFNAYSNKQVINVCACDLVEDSLFVQNTGDITSTFFIETEGEAAGWSNFAPNTFYLEQGERKEIKNFLNVPCKARGDNELTTKVRTLFGYEKSLTQTVHVDNCANVQIIQKSFPQTTCPCSAITYEFEIMNTGQHTESYRLDVTPYENYATVSDPILILEPGQSQTVYAFLNLPCDIHGQQTFSLNALAEGTGILGQMEFDLFIDACYDYRLETEDSYNVCLNVPNILPIEITNIVDIANRYVLTIDGPVWAHFENDTIFAWGLQTSVANLVLEPITEDLLTPEGTQMDQFSLTINAVTERGKIEESKNITINVENCYDLNVILQEDYVYGINGETKDYGILLENSGTKTSTYMVETFGPDWAILSGEPEVTLKPGENRELFVTTMVPEDLEDIQDISIVGTHVDYGLVRSNTFTLEPVTLEEAYNIDIQVEDKTISYEGDVIDIPVINLGVRQAEYLVTTITPEWILTENLQFTLSPGENTSILMHALPGEDVEADKYQVDIEITPTGTGLYYTTSFMLGVGQPGFMQWLADNWLIVLLIALPIVVLLALLIAWLIIRKRKEEQFKDSLQEGRLGNLEKVRGEDAPSEKKSKWWVIPLIILAVILLVAGGSFLAMHFIGGDTAAGDNETVIDPIDEPIVITDDLSETGGLITDEQGIITIDRSMIPGEGNVLEIDEPVQLSLELEVTNPTDKNVVFRLAVADDENSWLTIPQDEVYITPHSSKKTELIITPDIEQLKKTDYSITIGVTLTGEQIDYEQDVELILHKKSGFFDSWWFWLLIGLLVAGVAILILMSLKKDRPVEDHETIPIQEEKTYYTERAADTPTEMNIWKTLFIGLAILIIVLAALGTGWYLLSNAEDRETIDSEVTDTEDIIEDTQEIDELLDTVDNLEQDAIVEVDLSGYRGEGNELIVEDNTTIVLNMTIINPSTERALFTAVTSDESWITVKDPSIELVGKGSYQTQILINPDLELLKKQDYSISVNTTLDSEESSESYAQSLDFVIKKEKRFYESIWIYLLIGAVVAILAIFFIMRHNEQDNERYEDVFAEEAEEKPKKKAAAKPKKKRTKLQLGEKE